MTFLAATGLLNFLGTAFLGSFVLLKNPSSILNRRFFYNCASIALFSAGYFFWQQSAAEEAATFWFTILFIGIILINLTFLLYAFTLVGKIEKKTVEFVIYCIINAVFVYLCLNSMLYTRLEPRYDLGYWPVPTTLFSVYLAFWIFQCLYGFIIMIRSLKYTTGHLRDQIKYTIASGILAFIGGATNWPMWYSINFPPYFNICILIYTGTMGYAIIRYRLMDIRVVLSRTGIFVAIYTMVLGIPLIIGFRTGFGFLSFLALFVLATIGPILFPYMQRKAENMILAKQREYQQKLHDAAAMLLREHDLRKLVKLIIFGMKTIVKVEYAAIFLDVQEENRYRLVQASAYNLIPEESSIPYDDPIIETLRKEKRPLLHEEFSDYFTGPAQQAIQMLVPSFNNTRLLGFLVLGEKKDKSTYTTDDLRTFDIVSHQTALAVDNCLFIEERKKSQELLFQAEKLAFIGAMAEGVAHQIRNRLNHFSLASMQQQIEINDFISNHADIMSSHPVIDETFSSLNDISLTIIDNVKRTNAVIQGILNYTEIDKSTNYFGRNSFVEVVDRAAELARIKHGIDEFPLKLEIDPNSDGTVYCVMAQLIESMYNLIDNAYEAIEEKMRNHLGADERKVFQPLILIKLTRQADSSLIEITDNGIGIQDGDRNKIFAPYFTTKSSYKASSMSGFGLYVAQRVIAENHKGKIWFASEHMKGTTFSISLPSGGQ